MRLSSPVWARSLASHARPLGLFCVASVVLATAPGDASAASTTNITTVAGTGTAGATGDNAAATAAKLSFPLAVALAPGGGYYVVDQGNNKVRFVNTSGTITTIAGNGTAGAGGDGGLATAAQFDAPNGVAVLPNGSILVTDSNNNKVRRFTVGGNISTVVGTGAASFSGDNGAATAATIRFPVGIAALADSSYLIADTDNHRIRKVSATGTITTVAGTGSATFGGDGGAATAAQLNKPFGVSLYAGGGFFIADTYNQRVRLVNGAGNISTVAGSGVAGASGDSNPATSAQLNQPLQVTGRSDGSFYIADSGNSKIRFVSGGLIHTFAGTGTAGSLGDGSPAASAQLNKPQATVVLPDGDVLITDTFNHKIRSVDLTDAVPPPPPTPVAPTVSGAPQLTGKPIPGETLTCTTGGYTGTPTPTKSILWELAPRDVTSPTDPKWQVRAGQTASTYLVRAIEVGFRIRCRETAVNTAGTVTAPSSSLRADLGIPAPTAGSGPIVDPVAVVGREATCGTGAWDNAGEFKVEWIVNASFAGDGERYTPKVADHMKEMRCRVVGSNDVGKSDFVYSQAIRVIRDRPALDGRPGLFVTETGPKPTDRSAECRPGKWIDDFGQYTFQWYRASSAIPGATSSTYTATVADLGLTIKCEVTSTNILGTSQPVPSIPKLIPLPKTGSEGRLYTAINGSNYLSSTSMLAFSAEQLAAMESTIDARYQKIIGDQRKACASMTTRPPNFQLSRGKVLSVAETCSIFATGQTIINGGGGAFWLTQGCIPILPTAVPVSVTFNGINRFTGLPAYLPAQEINGTPLCPKLALTIPEYDRVRAREIDPGIASSIAASAPTSILWDINGDGRTEASCSPDSPVMRTILERGKYPKLRAVLVYADSERTGVYGIAAKDFDFSFGGGGSESKLRSAQAFACRTQMDPPPEPKLPCITAATIGRVEVKGNLCPVQSRNIPIDELNALPSDLQKVLREKNLVDNDRADKLSVKALRKLGTAYIGDGTQPFAALAAEPSPDQDYANNTIESILAIDTPPDLNTGGIAVPEELIVTKAQAEAYRQAIIDSAQTVPYFKEEAAVFATDQIYVAEDKVTINGVTLDPIGAATTILLPSDVKEAINSIKDMTISSSAAQLKMVSEQGKELAIGEANKFKSVLKESVQAPAQEFADKQLRSLADQLDIGPFKLADHVKIKLEKDGTASITASASLPIFTDLEGKSLSAKVDISANKSGKLTLKTINIKAPSALLGPVELRNLNITYDGGLSVTGQIIFGAGQSGIDITKFRLANGGKFEALGLKYNAGAGQGIPIGPGVFLTQIGGEFDLPGLDPDNGLIKAYAAVGAGQSVGRGCPAAGLKGDVTLLWKKDAGGRYFAIDAHAEPIIACVSFGKVDFHADTTGLFYIKGDGGISLGPIKVTAALNAQFQLREKFEDSRFQVDVTGHGEIAGLFEGTVKAMVSNKGIAGCGSFTVVKVPFIDELFGETVRITVAGGAGVRFINGVPPITPVQLLAGIRLFTGCDLGDFETFRNGRALRNQAAGQARVIPMPGGQETVALSIVGQGGPPRFTIKTQDGRILDYTNVPEKLTAMPTGSVAMAIPAESRTVVMFARPEKGDYTIETAPGSPAIADVQLAKGVPQPSVKVRVEGKGAQRTLRYDVKKIPGQSVRLVEVAEGASREIKTVSGGGKGSKPFRVTEATKPGGRTVVAEVSQGGLPRTQLKVATFSAPNPKLGKARGLKLKRSKGKATVSWKKLVGAETYVVRVTRAGGRRETYRPDSGKTSFQITDLDGPSEQLTIRLVGISLAGKQGPAVTLRSRPK